MDNDKGTNKMDGNMETDAGKAKRTTRSRDGEDEELSASSYKGVGEGSGVVITDDCPQPPTDRPAGSMTNEEQIFGKRSSLARTPPSKMTPWRASTSTSMGADETEDEGESQVSKRKRRESPKEKEERNTKVVDEVNKLIREIKDTSKELCGLVKSNPNTKVEIKRMVAKLERQTENLSKRSVALRPVRLEMSRLECRSVGTQATGHTEGREMKRSVGVQTEEEGGRNEKAKKGNREEIERIHKLIRESHEDEDFLENMQGEWPEEAFRASKEEVGNPLDKEGDLAVITVDAKLDRGIGRLVKGRYPDLEEAEVESKDEGRVGYLITSTKRKEAGNIKITDRLICKVACDLGEEGNERMNMIRAIRGIRKIMLDEGRTKMNVALPEKVDPETLRKIVEVVFRDEMDREIVVCRPTDKRGMGVEQRANPGRREVSSSAVIIKAGGKDYVQLLKEVTSKVENSGEEVGDQIGKVRKTQTGDLLILVQGGEEVANRLKEMITRDGNIQAKPGRGEKLVTLNVMGIDSSVEPKEAEKEIRRKLEGRAGVKLEMGTARPTQEGNYNVFVKVDGESAKFLRKDR